MKNLVLASTVLLATSMYSTAFAQARHQAPVSTHYDYSSQAICALNDASALALQMRDFVDPYTFGDVFQPIQIQAAIAMDTIRDLGALSAESRNSVLVFVSLVDSNNQRILDLLRTTVHFERARSLLSSVRRLKRELL